MLLNSGLIILMIFLTVLTLFHTRIIKLMLMKFFIQIRLKFHLLYIPLKVVNLSDGISLEHISNSNSLITQSIVLLINNMICQSYFPKSFKKLILTYIIPIIKNKNKRSNDSSNYRPICISKMLLNSGLIILMIFLTVLTLFHTRIIKLMLMKFCIQIRLKFHLLYIPLKVVNLSDGISLEHISNSNSLITQSIVLLINNMICQSYFPKSFKKLILSYIIPIIKNKNKRSNDSSNYRPICISKIICMIIEKVIYNRISSLLVILDNY